MGNAESKEEKHDGDATVNTDSPDEDERASAAQASSEFLVYDEEDADEDFLGQYKNKSYWRMFRDGYEDLVNAIIRPPRAEYEVKELGPVTFCIGDRVFIRTDFPVENSRGQTLHCSFWQPRADCRPAEEMPCVIYLHGNAGCRLAALEMLHPVLACGACVLALDTAGSGMSDGDYVTLGQNEKDDLQAVIAWLRDLGSVSAIGLWGRSMGAATSLLHSHRDPTIGAMVLDSPFSDLRLLTDEIVAKAKEDGMNVPTLVLKAAFKVIKNSVYKRSGLQVDHLKPIADVDKAFTPALFAHALGDDFILPRHSEEIHDRYSGDKNLVTFQGDHNSYRPRFFINSAVIFLQTYLQIPPSHTVDINARCTLPEAPEMWSMLPLDANAGATSMDEYLALNGGADEDGFVPIVGHRPTRHDDRVTDDDILQQVLLLSLQEAEERQAKESKGGDSNDDSEVACPGTDAGEQKAREILQDMPEIACPTCTLLNRAIMITCDACGTPLPRTERKQSPEPSTQPPPPVEEESTAKDDTSDKDGA